MIIYSHTPTPRLQYIVRFLSDYYNHPFKLTANEQVYLASEDHKINYSHQRISKEEIYINPHALLFESEKRKVKAEVFEQHGYKAFFETAGDVHFDLLAAIFYLVTRYEEYLPHQRDEYGRYAHQNALAYKEGFLHQPLINIWLQDFAQLLMEKFPELSFPKKEFSFLPTYDIDIAWCYKNKGVKRNSGSIAQYIFKGQWKIARERLRVLKGKQPDPFDAYEWMDNLHQQYNLNPIYFFLVAEEKGKYDKNTDIRNPEFQQLIKDTAAKYKVGIHPSWFSGDHKSYLPKEKSWLENICHKPINSSRQHYLRFHLPDTYQRLMSIGVTNEHSMGYGTINGFRASIASPFYWYDLEREQATNLVVHPFCFMDANAYYEQKHTPEQAYDELITLYNEIKAVGGTMSTLWHNSFLGTAPMFAGWRETYERFVQQISTTK